MPRPATVTRLPGLRLGQANDNGALDWRRGLRRMWVLISVAWILAWSVYLTIWTLRRGIDRPGDLLAVPVLLFGPPLALLLFGLATAWAFRGFAPDKRP